MSRPTDEQPATALRADVVAGLTGQPKTLRPIWFYDQRGSELFEQITELPEYYLTRVERELLAANAGDIAVRAQASTLVELGSGSSSKTRLLLDAVRATGSLRRYIPVDVSQTALASAAAAISSEYPGLAVEPVIADFTAELTAFSASHLPGEGPRMFAFLGSTIGNLAPAERAEFWTRLRGVMSDSDTLLLGTDLVKDPATLVAAYNDSLGVTAAFNLNVLTVLNRRLGADFAPERFSHVAVWNAAEEWIEMRLRATGRQTVKIPAVDLVVEFAEGEELRTEISAKFRRTGVRAELARGGFRMTNWWTDPAERFALSLCEVPSLSVARSPNDRVAKSPSDRVAGSPNDGPDGR